MRFVIGEMAKFVVASVPRGIPKLGVIVEIVAVGPWMAGEWISIPHGETKSTPRAADYLCMFPGDEFPAVVSDWQLQKLNPPEEPLFLVRELEEQT